jgi:hypothetical protein
VSSELQAERPPVGDLGERKLYTTAFGECLLATDRVPYPVGEFPA